MGIISFTDVNGNPVGAQTPVSLAAEQATFLDLPGQAVVPALGARTEVIGIFTPTAAGPAPGVCIPSLEVYDQFTGFTRVLLPPGPVNIPPGPSQ